ncbi:MAG: MFS transporter [Promethearchaeota archaeon]|nr:MAG: MFS transporter [Candidatus Lokiarchaeota archaeon]
MISAVNSFSDGEIQRNLKKITIDGYTSKVMVILSTGPFLVAFALLLGANNFTIGLIAAIPPLVQIIQIPSIQLVERIRKRRVITVISLTLYRICIFSMALIPFIYSIEFGLIFLIIFLIAQSVFASIGHTAWASWMHDTIPLNQLGAFYSKRLMLSTIVALLTSLLAAIFIDYWAPSNLKSQIFGYSILFIIAFIFGMVSIYFISRVSEPRMIGPEFRMKFSKMIIEPFKDKNYRNILLFLGVWSFAINLAAPFFTVYMIKKLQFSITLIILFTIISQITTVLFLRIWGRLIDKFSNKSVLNVCCPLLILCIFTWTFIDLPSFYIIIIPLLIIIHIFMGISMAGIILATQNISLKLAPKGRGNSYLAVTTVVSSLSLGIAPIIGGIFADYFESSELTWTLKFTAPNGNLSLQTLNLQGFDFYFIFAFLIGLISLFRLVKINEGGDVKRRMIIYELFTIMKNSMRNLSTIGGIDRIFPPYSSVIYRPKRNKFRFKNRRLKNIKKNDL